MIYAAPIGAAPEPMPAPAMEQPMIYAAPAGGAPMTYTAAPQYIDAAPITTTGGSAAAGQPVMYAAPEQAQFAMPGVPAPEYMAYSAPMQYSAPVQYVTADPVYTTGAEYSAAPMTYAPMTYSAPLQYSSAPMVYSSAPVQYVTPGTNVDAFAQMDTNGDGVLSREEFGAAVGR